MNPLRWTVIRDAIWTVELQLEAASCEDGGSLGPEDEATQVEAYNLLRDVTSIRKRLQHTFETPSIFTRVDGVEVPETPTEIALDWKLRGY